MPGDRFGVGAVVLAEQIARDPFGVLAEDLMIDVFEQLDLDRVAGPVDRLDPVDDRAADAADEIAVEEGDRSSQSPRQFCLPVLPAVKLVARERRPV